jgi:predicted ATPase
MSVLIGKNGAGKSSFVDVLRLVRDILTLGLEDAV